MLLKHLFYITLASASFISFSYQAVVVDYPRYGNYEIVSCGHTTGLISYDLQQSSVYLQKAINSIGANSHSYSNANAYKALFNGVNPVEVKQLFQQIADGANFSIPGTKASARPRIICATTDAQHIWDICQQSEVPAAWAYNTPYIFLCPAFWQNLPLAPKSESCGSLTQDGKFLTGNGLMRSQYTILVQELARMYFTNLGKHFLQPEVNGQNGAMALPATKSVINPTSYALYAGNILAGCTQFPTRPIQKPLRGLLEDNPSRNNSIIVQLSQNCTNVNFEDLDFATCPLTIVPN